MAEQLRVFVSHSHEDNKFCQQIVQALRDAGADVWYDEHNLGSGVLRREIMRELSARPVVLVVLSRAAFASSWVQDECEWAYNLYRRKPDRLILPVVGGAYALDDFDTMLYLEAMKRIEAPDQKPLPPATAINRLLRALALTPAGASPAPIAPQPSESADDLLTRGKALVAQQQYAEALPLFERATQLEPQSDDTWGGLIYTYDKLRRYEEALAAFERVQAIDTNDAQAWFSLGTWLVYLRRYELSLAADERALALDPNNARVWFNKGIALHKLLRNKEAVAAFDHALALDPKSAEVWFNKGVTLRRLRRFAEALAAFERALDFVPDYAIAWHNKALALRALGRVAEAAAAEQRARELGW